MWQSFKEYITALGRWGWVVVADIILTGAGAYLDLSSGIIPTWVWITLGLLALIIAPFVAFHKLRVQRDKLKAEKDSKESKVELTDFNRELEYRVMEKGSKLVIAIRLKGILRNRSLENSGSLSYFGLSIDTPHGFYSAESNNPPFGYKFEPNFIYGDRLFVFIGELDEPHLKIQSWIPYIKGAEGRIILDVQGQEIKNYPIKIANEQGFQL